MNKRMVAAAVVAVLLGGCEGTEETAVYRLKSVAISDKDDNQTGLRVYSFNGGGELSKVRTYNDKGVDGEWGTSDDVLAYYSTCDLNGVGSVNYRDLSVEYSALPLNAAALVDWKTLDPRSVHCADVTMDYPQANERTFTKGDDGVWDTTDDEEGFFLLETISGGSRWTTATGELSATTRTRDFVYYTDADTGGLKAIHVTEKSDSTVEFEGHYTYTFNLSGQLTRRVLADAPVNAFWGDSDDRVHSYVQVARATGITTLSFYDGPGADATWFTSDDRQSGYRIYENADGLLRRETNATAPGTDGLWMTADDPVTVLSFNYRKL